MELFTSVAIGVTNIDPPPPAALPSPSTLTCEFLRDPESTVIFDPAPEFGWQCGHGEGAYNQAAYQIVVQRVSRPGNSSEVVWDSGRVASDQSINVSYAGEALEPDRAYQWSIRTEDAEGNRSPWSTPQTFHMADRLDAARTSRERLQIIEQPPETIHRLPEETVLVDFGRAAFGYLKLRLPPSTQPRELTVRFGERLSDERVDRNPGGTVRYYEVVTAAPAHTTEWLVHPPRDRRNTSGAAIRLPSDVGVIAPFRAVELSGPATQDITAAAVSRCAVQYPFDPSASDFESSSDTLNEIWDLCKHSIEATTFCGVYVDGDRERIPYEADAYINQLCHYGVDQEYALARHSHEYLIDHPTWPTEWKLHSVLMAWADYLYTGDHESLRTCYETLVRDKLLTRAELPSGLVDTSNGYRDIVDWPAGERDGHDMRPVNTVVNAFHYAALDKMSRVAEALGKDLDAIAFRARSRKLADAFNRQLWSAENDAYIDGVGSSHSSIHSNLFPLALGLVPEDRVDKVIAFLRSGGMACSVYAAQYLVEGLYKYNASDYAFSLFTSTEERSWHNMLREGSTITLEAWSQRLKPNLDWNHAWGAAPANLIPRYVVGVRPSEPGFRRVIIQPQPAELDWFTAKAPSIRGPIEVDYRRESESVSLKIATPGNCVADIAIPIPRRQRLVRLTASGEPMSWEVRDQHAWVDRLAPGTYEIEARFSAADSTSASLEVRLAE